MHQRLLLRWTGTAHNSTTEQHHTTAPHTNTRKAQKLTACEGVHRHVQAAAVQAEAERHRNLMAQPVGREAADGRQQMTSTKAERRCNLNGSACGETACRLLLENGAAWHATQASLRSGRKHPWPPRAAACSIPHVTSRISTAAHSACFLVSKSPLSQASANCKKCQRREDSGHH